MSTEQQQQPIANEADAQVDPAPLEEHKGGETSGEPVKVTAQEDLPKEDAPKQGSTLLSNLPQFWKKTFEKKHEDHALTEPADPTETSDAQPEKSEKRSSRTLMDLIHKKPSKPENQTEPAPVSPEGHDIDSEPSGKEPLIDHLRKLFAKKPADSPADQDAAAPAIDATNVTDTVPTDLPSEERPTSLSRRLSKMAQTLTSRIKETNHKKKVDEPIEETAAPEATPLPDAANHTVLPVPASA